MSLERKGSMRTFCIIPALNEATRIQQVLNVALACEQIDLVVVVDSCSQDNTANVARDMGAMVLYCQVPGKGEAVSLAVRELAHDNDNILILDADYTGLKQEHLTNILGPVVCGEFIQSAGVIDSLPGRLYWRWHIGLTGARAFKASLLWEIYELDYMGWALETALNAICRWSPRRQKRPIAKTLLMGVSSTDKWTKYPTKGLALKAKLNCLLQWLLGTIRFNLAIKYKHWLT